MRISVTRLRPVSVLALLLSGALITGRSLQGAEGDEALIVQCTSPCAAVIAAVAAAGGVVTHQYDNVGAVAVRMPRGAVPALVSVAGADAVRKDANVAPPRVSELADVSAQLALPAALDDARGREAVPANYNYNLAFTNVGSLHAAGKRGENVRVAVIDSGSANVAGRIAASGAEREHHRRRDVRAPAQDPLSATHRENVSHGTMTAEMVAAHTAFLFLNTSRLVLALNLYAPGSAIACTVVPGNCGLPPAVAAIASMVPMTGTAPGAKIYAMKVFPASGGGAPESRLIAAMDRAITLRRNYNRPGPRRWPRGRAARPTRSSTAR